MNLKDFISETIQQIAEGVAEAQEPVRQAGGMLNPLNIQFKNTIDSYVTVDSQKHAVRRVEFDIAVTATNEKQVSGKGGLRVMSFELGGEGSETTGSESVSRIKFGIYMALPVDNSTSE